MPALEHTHYTVTQARKYLASGYASSRGRARDFTDVRCRYIDVDALSYYSVNYVSVGGLHADLEKQARRDLANVEHEIAHGYYLPGRMVTTPLQRFDLWTDLTFTPFRERLPFRRRLLMEDYKLTMDLNDWYLECLSDIEEYYAKRSEYTRKYGHLLEGDPEYEEDFER